MGRGKPRKPNEWRSILDGLKASGLTQKKYAEQVGCHPSNFSWWRKRLKDLDQTVFEATAPAFIELRGPEVAPRGEQVDANGHGPVTMQSRSGVLVTFASLPPAEYIARIMREG